jgi:hypothetical protein
VQWVEVEGGGMLFKRCCDRTGVVNFFSDTEPFLAAGSIVQIAPSHFVWHSHLDDRRKGVARYLPVAEAHLYRALGSVHCGRIIAKAA